MVTKTKVGRSFIFKSDTKLTEEQAQEEQIKLGYHPCGYGFYQFNGFTWSCQDSCD